MVSVTFVLNCSSVTTPATATAPANTPASAATSS
jgi:hypothetical protein